MDTTIFSIYLLPVIISLIMFNLGLSLTVDDFKRTFKMPKALIVGLACQMVLLPLIAFGLAFVSDLPPEIKVGLVIIAVCPGGATANLITYLLKGDVALSISLTSINSILILFTIPGITYLALETFLNEETIIALPFFQTISNIFLMILLPTFIGLIVRMRFPQPAKEIERYMKYITTILLAIIFAFTIFYSGNETENPFELYWSATPSTLALNIIGMLAGYFIGYLAGFSKEKKITIVVEVGIQNSALAITIASSQAFLGNILMAIPALIYGMFTFFNAVIFGYIIKRWLR